MKTGRRIATGYVEGVSGLEASVGNLVFLRAPGKLEPPQTGIADSGPPEVQGVATALL